MAAYQTEVILEIARGDSIEELLEARVIARRSFLDASGNSFRAFGVIGGSTVPATVDGNTITFAGMTKQKNAYGFGHGQRPIYSQAECGCFIHSDVFIG